MVTCKRGLRQKRQNIKKKYFIQSQFLTKIVEMFKKLLAAKLERYQAKQRQES